MTLEKMTYSRLLTKAAQEFAILGFETPKLDARLLLQEASDFSHAQFISSGDDICPEETDARYREFVERRKLGEPVHRILGYREFFGREFELSAETLVPRPDTEILIETVLENLDQSKASILDIGTGSGVIAVTLAAELEGVSIVASDISENALATAKENAFKHGVEDRMSFVTSDVFASVDGEFDLIVSNPPYIPTQDLDGLSREVREFDPHTALDGGADGLEFYRHIFASAREYLVPSGMLIVEVGIDQALAVIEMAMENEFALKELRKDLSGVERVLMFEMPSVA